MPYGSVLVTSIGLAFAEQPVTPPPNTSDSLDGEKLLLPAELTRAATLDPQDSS
jgi:hypothetical protein